VYVGCTQERPESNEKYTPETPALVRDAGRQLPGRLRQRTRARLLVDVVVRACDDDVRVRCIDCNGGLVLVVPGCLPGRAADGHL
jgi:hypothetical protein